MSTSYEINLNIIGKKVGNLIKYLVLIFAFLFVGCVGASNKAKACDWEVYKEAGDNTKYTGDYLYLYAGNNSDHFYFVLNVNGSPVSFDVKDYNKDTSHVTTKLFNSQDGLGARVTGGKICISRRDRTVKIAPRELWEDSLHDRVFTIGKLEGIDMKSDIQFRWVGYGAPNSGKLDEYILESSITVPAYYFYEAAGIVEDSTTDSNVWAQRHGSSLTLGMYKMSQVCYLWSSAKLAESEFSYKATCSDNSLWTLEKDYYYETTGQWWLNVSITNSLGEIKTYYKYFMIDTTPPGFVGITPNGSDGNWLKTDAGITVNYDDGHSGTTEIQYCWSVGTSCPNEGDWQPGTPNGTESDFMVAVSSDGRQGSYYLHVRGIDALGNKSAPTSSLEYKIDSIVPESVIYTPESGLETNKVEITGYVSDDQPGSLLSGDVFICIADVGTEVSSFDHTTRDSQCKYFFSIASASIISGSLANSFAAQYMSLVFGS